MSILRKVFKIDCTLSKMFFHKDQLLLGSPNKIIIIIIIAVDANNAADLPRLLVPILSCKKWFVFYIKSHNEMFLLNEISPHWPSST